LDDLCAALLDKNEPRHILADSVVQAAWSQAQDRSGLGEIFRLALKPKWRYLPSGFRWFYRRLKSV
jgi:hypothetical protein